MIRATTEDSITSQIPAHIIERFPNFVEFLKAYYEWLNLPGNPYERIKNHMDYLNFEKSLDDYVDFMKLEYLTKIPISALGDSRLFIEWSKKLGLSRGSHESYKFLFKMLFGEDTTEIYLPKDNILKTSDGKWISGESVIVTTNSGDPERFAYKRIYQEREVFPGVFERAEATVDSSYIIRYSNSLNVVEFTLTDIIGEFKPGYKVFNEDGDSEWPIPIIVDFDIVNGGQNYFKSDRILLPEIPTFSAEYQALEAGKIDTRLTTTLQKSQITVEVNGTVLNTNDYSYDGQYITSSLIGLGSLVKFSMNIYYNGSMFVDKIGPNGEIEKVHISSTPIVVAQDNYDLNIVSSFGNGGSIIGKNGLIRSIPGYYIGNKGQLSTNMFLQDSNYYQDYSYEIRTERDIKDYAQIVKDVLHPGGFKLFGKVRLLNIVELLIGAVSEDSGAFVLLFQHYGFARYGINSKYLWIAKAGYISDKVYKGTEWDQSYIDGEVGYDLTDKSQERTYDLEGNQIEIEYKGWMTKQLLSDFAVFQPNDYLEIKVFDGYYLEDGFIVGSSDDTTFINTYINNYGSTGYVDEEYWD